MLAPVAELLVIPGGCCGRMEYRTGKTPKHQDACWHLLLGVEGKASV